MFSLMAAQLVLMAGGYAVHFFVARRLGPSDYGTLGVVMAFLIWAEVSLTAGFPYAIRKFGSENSSLVPAIARAAIRGQFIHSMLLFALAMAAAPFVAKLLRDPKLTALIRLASLDIPVFAFYFCYTAVLNCRRRYTLQSGAMMAYAACKVGTMLTLVALGFGVAGALVGNILASVAGLGAALVFAGGLPKAQGYPIRELVKFAGGTSALAVTFTLLVSIDLFAVKAFMSNPDDVGFYTAASALAKAPFMVFLGIATATLPALSRAWHEDDPDEFRAHLVRALRTHLLLAAPVTAILAGESKGIIDLLFGARYASGAAALPVLALAMTCAGLLNALYNSMVARGDSKTPLLGTIGLIAAAVVLNVTLVPRLGMLGAAIALLITTAVGLAVFLVIGAMEIGRLIAPATAARSVVGALIVYGVAKAMPANGTSVIGASFGLIFLYITAMIAMGEVSRSEVVRLNAIVSRRRRRTREEPGLRISKPEIKTDLGDITT